MSPARQRERSDTSKVTRRLRERMLNFTKYFAHHKKAKLKKLNAMFCPSFSHFFVEVSEALRLPRK
jgi:hypothetical protein